MGKASILKLATHRALNYSSLSLLRLQRAWWRRTREQNAGFFDSYPRFFSTSKTRPQPNRLNHRYRALIESNEGIIRDRAVLDLTSHDGRWSFAAYRAGARYVLGIEAREHLVQFARANMREYGVPEGRVEFVRGDVFEELERLDPGAFDTVFCFGFFYHTLHHMLLLTKISRLCPQSLILDTNIDPDPGTVIVAIAEPVEVEGTGAFGDPGDSSKTLVGIPTKSAVELMLGSAGFTFSYYDWHSAGIKRWDTLEDYHEGIRISLVATRKSATPGPTSTT